MILLLILFSSSFCATWEWAVSAGAGNLDRVWDIALDTQGNIYVTGEFVDTLQAGNLIVNGFGLSDIFVVKYSPQGNPIWAKAFGGIDGDIGLGVDTDLAGNIYVTGLITGTAQFEDETLTSAGGWDIFILKLDPSGNIVWVHREGGVNSDIGYGISTHADGRCYVTGWFGETLTLHDNSTLISYGGSDIFAFSCDTNGNILWSQSAGTAEVEYGYKIDNDIFGNAYVTGQAGAGSNFDGMTLNGDGAFIASYDSSGDIRWLNCGIGAGVNSIAVDRTNSVIEQFGCITGRITGTAQFGSFNLSSMEGSDDAYGAVFQLLTGEWSSAEIGGGTGSDKGRACTYKNHPYYTGSFEGEADLFGYDVISGGASDGFVYSAGTSENRWLLTEGGVNNDVPTDIVVDNAGNVFICGWYSGTARFGSNIVINSGNDSDLDMFIAKINPSVSADDNIAPAVSSFIRCYPNPFKHKLVIVCDLPDAKTRTSNKLQIYNIKGEKVQSVPLTRVDDNSRQAEWDGCDSDGFRCPSGVYFVKLNDSIRGTGKVLLLN
jgi:hypothetical protein